MNLRWIDRATFALGVILLLPLVVHLVSIVFDLVADIIKFGF